MFERMLVAAVVALGLTSGTSAQEELKIGGIGSLSGGGTAWGLALQRGVELAIDDVNKAGGLKIGGKVYRPRLAWSTISTRPPAAARRRSA